MKLSHNFLRLLIFHKKEIIKPKLYLNVLNNPIIRKSTPLFKRFNTYLNYFKDNYNQSINNYKNIQVQKKKIVSIVKK